MGYSDSGMYALFAVARGSKGVDLVGSGHGVVQLGIDMSVGVPAVN